jgi:hypothetical protein
MQNDIFALFSDRPTRDEANLARSRGAGRQR